MISFEIEILNKKTRHKMKKNDSCLCVLILLFIFKDIYLKTLIFKDIDI
jgi:hypothetical protein